MAIQQITTDFAGQVNVQPRIVRILCDDTFADVTAANYLQAAKKMGFQFLPSDIVAINYGTTAVSQFFTLAITSTTITLEPMAGDVTLPVIANHIAVFSNTSGALADDAATAINGGNIQAGLSGTAGALASFPATAAKGSLKVVAVANTGDTVTTVSNAAMGQASVVSIPDPGAATANFILNKSSASTQTIETGLSITGAANNVQTTGGGNLIAGSSGAAGSLFSYPATASKGSLEIRGADNTGDTDVVITNREHGQATTYSIGDVGQSTGSVLVSKVAADPNANLISFDVTVGQAALATGGSVTLIDSSGTKQYKIRSLQLNSGGTNFSGGGGDRLGQVTDSTTVYSVIPAATMQTLTNEQWGTTGLPNPASAAINTSTVAGADLVFKYSGGATDYTTGSLVISGIAERVA
jgi:hypothetical protein